MYEIEAKVWVKDDEKWLALVDKIKTSAVFQKEEIKEDVYFGRAEEDHALFRLRTINKKKHEVSIKDKIIKCGIEQNKEDSFEVSDVRAFYSFVKKLDLKIILKKEKKSVVYTQGDLLIELNTIDKLGNFLEIEYLFDDKEEIELAHQKINSIFEELGFKREDLEERTYSELLQLVES